MNTGMLGPLFLISLFIHAEAAGPSQIPVLCYHQLDNSASFFSISTSQFTWQMDTLVSLGYQTITPYQYVNWLQGDASTLPAKPILVTFDDNIANAFPAAAIMQARGLAGVMYIVSGYADLPDGWNMPWGMLSNLQASGWTIQLHAGPLGHAFMTQTPNCPYFNGCRLPNETASEYQARVTSDLDQGIAKLKQYNFISDNSVTFALPFDFYGQGTTDTAVTSWLPGKTHNLPSRLIRPSTPSATCMPTTLTAAGHLASRFPVVFEQDWGYTGPIYNRRYRFGKPYPTTRITKLAGPHTHTHTLTHSIYLYIYIYSHISLSLSLSIYLCIYASLPLALFVSCELLRLS